jgi:hypothetical protein
LTRLGLAVTATLLGLAAVTAVATADPTDPARPLNSVLAVTLTFNKTTYRPEEIPTVRVRLTNKDNLPLTGIVAVCEHGESEPNLTGAGRGWGALAGGGVTIPGGMTKVVEVYEAMPALAAAVGHVRVDCAFAQSGVDYGANPRARAEAAVPGGAATSPGTPTTNPPAPAVGTPHAQARTGTNVVAPGFAGVLAVLLGTGTRRRRLS